MCVKAKREAKEEQARQAAVGALHAHLGLEREERRTRITVLVRDIQCIVSTVGRRQALCTVHYSHAHSGCASINEHLCRSLLQPIPIPK